MSETIYAEAEALLKAGKETEAFALLRARTESEPGNAKAWFELAGAFDFLGREAEALPQYEQAAALGEATLPPGDRPRLYLQWGSTLRNLKKFEASAAVLDEGLQKFPHHAALLAFRALTAYSSGSFRKSAQLFLEAALAPGESLRDYARALGFYRDSLEIFPKRHRRWMRFPLSQAKEPPAVSGLEVATLAHALPLAHLMEVAYQGSVDHEGETPAECLAEMEGTLNGKYGPYLAAASFIAVVNGQVAAASLVTLWKGDPLLAFSMTDPAHRGKGLAGALIRHSLHALRGSGHRELLLVVTEGNIPAEKLYRKLGFEPLGVARAGRGVWELRDD
jgi:tetratricopeptide (TPR) repeat protein